MGNGRLVGGWLLTIIVAAYLGFHFGQKAGQVSQQFDGKESPQQANFKQVTQLERLPQMDGEQVGFDSSSNNNPDPQILSSEEKSENVPERERENRLAETGEALAWSSDVGREHYKQGLEFAAQFSEDDSDWQAKTNITDFLQLHADVERIDLQKIICDERRCQLIGQYAGKHQDWEAVLEAMRGQDWWDYSGTSSTSSSKDENTYFNVYLNKSDNQDN